MVKVLVIDNSFFRDGLEEIKSFTKTAIRAWAKSEGFHSIDVEIRGGVATIGHDDGSVVLIHQRAHSFSC
jgi:frataxin-like iron-binding protein CyaY